MGCLLVLPRGGVATVRSGHTRPFASFPGGCASRLVGAHSKCLEQRPVVIAERLLTVLLPGMPRSRCFLPTLLHDAPLLPARTISETTSALNVQFLTNRGVTPY
jgi:hypothetical protein